jgi:hypothetical protein
MVSNLDENDDYQFVCRALSECVLRRLIIATRTSPEWHESNGVDRSWFYGMGAMTRSCRSKPGANVMSHDGYWSHT